MTFIPWITDMKGNKPEFHIFKKHDSDKVTYRQFSSLLKRRLMSINVIEAYFDKKSKYYSKILTFYHRKKNDATDCHVLLYSEDEEIRYADLCLCSCTLNLKDLYRHYLRSNKKKQFLLSDKSCLVKVTFFSSSPFYHKLFSDTVELIESGISLKPVENIYDKEFQWIEFGFTFEGINIFIDCSLSQIENKAFDKILDSWNIFLNNTMEKNGCYEEFPSNYEISFERSVMEFLYDLGITFL